ncbi:methyltransferase domain-containing protein [Aquicoccus porphyridii]|uniref:Methyltransferase domain-containing protein n=1 Tax=Aquicoccus porphyridii TaxID=1852029 RepID=A0A5A9ZV85_9RHOB|nr:methyltransferase domain-containing protein [Aquicoccus porphyridii]KAA0920856.1 methyltransferase domain-containing protein [Aquicoccus porphyridii]RAI56866.1 methyltransferase type 11 [Rhodobacteraceae bacterium AsT-22]
MSKEYLDKVYELTEGGDSRALYAEWAETYEAELAANGYATPTRIATALARFSKDKSAPLLDYGCGTGLSGAALHKAGFTTIDGIDATPEMLEIARTKSVYRNLDLANPAQPAPITPGAHSMIAAIGVIGIGAAPLSLFDELMTALPRGGLFAFSFNDHSLEQPEYEAKIMEWTDGGASRLLCREHGDHIPGKDLKSNIYVLEKA